MKAGSLISRGVNEGGGAYLQHQADVGADLSAVPRQGFAEPAGGGGA